MTTTRLKIATVNAFPWLAGLSRYVKAVYYSCVGQKPSYSQHGEDKFVLETLNQSFPGTQYNYIDVGGFHPMLLSNTYLLYRMKMNGVIIEPNPELVKLHRLFRSRDIQLGVACGCENTICKFYLQKTFPALSSLKGSSDKTTKTRYVPLMNLDSIVAGLDFTTIHFLSVDVEGFDFAVLQGAEKVLQHTFIVCVETNSIEEEKQVSLFLQERQFLFLKKFDCNLIFKNMNFRP